MYLAAPKARERRKKRWDGDGEPRRQQTHPQCRRRQERRGLPTAAAHSGRRTSRTGALAPPDLLRRQACMTARRTTPRPRPPHLPLPLWTAGQRARSTRIHQCTPAAMPPTRLDHRRPAFSSPIASTHAPPSTDQRDP